MVSSATVDFSKRKNRERDASEDVAPLSPEAVVVVLSEVIAELESIATNETACTGPLQRLQLLRLALTVTTVTHGA